MCKKKNRLFKWELVLYRDIKNFGFNGKYMQGGVKLLVQSWRPPNSKTKKNFFGVGISKKTRFFFL